MLFKGFFSSNFSFSDHFFIGTERFSNFGRGSPKENFSEIILKSGHSPRRRCCLKVFLILALATILFSGVERFSNFGRGSPKEHYSEIISKSGH